jgi:hypothetical protein
VSELTVAQLQARLEEFAAARDWRPFHNPKNLAAALSVEAAELLEIFQWLTPEQAAAVMDDPDRAHRVEDELSCVASCPPASQTNCRAPYQYWPGKLKAEKSGAGLAAFTLSRSVRSCA